MTFHLAGTIADVLDTALRRDVLIAEASEFSAVA
jgi:hypothetical protein